jgi:hypothetical protein
MENITIKSVTHCPTCGSECKVEGGTTHYYIPIKKYTEEDIRKVIDETIKACNISQKEFYGDLEIDTDKIINSLNKQD